MEANKIDIMPEANLGIEHCINGTPERNITILCCEVDFAFQYQHLPIPRQLFRHIVDNHNIGLVRE